MQDIDFYYGNPFGGCDVGWQSTLRDVYIDPRNFNPDYLPEFEELLIQQLALMNFMFDTSFMYLGRSEFDWSTGWNEWPFIAIRFDKKLSWAFATAAPSIDFNVNPTEWHGGTMTIYHRTFPKWGNIRRNVFKVLNHEMMHILGTVHTSFAPSVVNTFAVGNNELNGLGYMPWDMAVINKYKAGYQMGEAMSPPLPIKCNSHITRLGKKAWLFIPVYMKDDEAWTAVFKQVADNAWSMVFNTSLTKNYFTNQEDYQFLNCSVMDSEEETIYLFSTFDQGQVNNEVLERDSMGVWRFLP